jgi:transcriptional regulator with XRE-family HTH domain
MAYIFICMNKKPGPRKWVRFKDLPTPTLGQVLVKLRKQRGLTQVQLAEKMGATKRAVAYYERKMTNPSIATIEMLASALEVPKEKLLGLNKKNLSEEAPVAQSRMLQQVWPLAVDLPIKDQQYIAKMIRTLAAQSMINEEKP